MQDEKKRDEEIQVPAFEVFKAWAKENYPELLVALGISDTLAPAEPAPEQPTAETADKVKGSTQSMIKMIAEKVKSFYNRDNPEVGPFRGSENIAMDVKKSVEEQYGSKAGEQAYQMAEALIEKLSNEWHQRHGQVSKVSGGDGLARLKELVGNIKTKVEGMGEGNGPDKSQVPAYKRKEQGGDWKMTTKDLEKEKTNSPTSSAGLARRKAELGMSEELSSIMKLSGLAK
jgi:hypothetical protein